MGGYISCASKSVTSNTLKVIHSNGSVQDLHTRINAAELMLDNPQHFVCHANSLQIGRRINPLAADEELDLGYLYFLLPMPKLHSVLSETDIASLALKANSAMKATGRRSSGARILPLFGDLMRPLLPELKKDVFLLEEGKQISGAQEELFALPKLNLEDDPELSTTLAQLRINTAKSWKPKLRPLTSSGQSFGICCSRILNSYTSMNISVQSTQLLITLNSEFSLPISTDSSPCQICEEAVELHTALLFSSLLRGGSH